MTARILVVDDIPAIRHSMRSYLQQEADWVICGEAENRWPSTEFERVFDQVLSKTDAVGAELHRAVRTLVH